MSNVLFLGDLHFGHKGIQRFRGLTEEENRETIIENWNKKVTKRDIVYVMGDAVFHKDTLQDIKRLHGTKYLVRGNHDMLTTAEYSTVFREIFGITKYKGFWLSHAPVHPAELRGCRNIHGHVHYSTIRQPGYQENPVYDYGYFNTSCEMLNYTPFSLEEINSITQDSYQKMAELCESKRIGSLEHCA